MMRILGFVLATLIVTVNSQHRYRLILTKYDYEYEACQKIVCPTEFDPICDDTVNVYYNKCDYQRTECLWNNIIVTKNKTCTSFHFRNVTRPPLSFFRKHPDSVNICFYRLWFCPFNFDPICDQYGKPYYNECYLLRAKCLNKGLKLEKTPCKSAQFLAVLPSRSEYDIGGKSHDEKNDSKDSY